MLVYTSAERQGLEEEYEKLRGECMAEEAAVKLVLRHVEHIEDARSAEDEMHRLTFLTMDIARIRWKKLRGFWGTTR